MLAIKRKAKPPLVRYFNHKKASTVLKEAGFEKNTTICGFNNGQFSSIDLITSVLEYTGKADITIASWTAAASDINHIYDSLKNGNIRSMRWVLDRSFLSRQPDVFKKLMDVFGKENIRIAKSHAKFSIIENHDWKVVIETSMNLNKNASIENFAVTECPRFVESYKSLVEDIFDLQPVVSTTRGDHASNKLIANIKKKDAEVFDDLGLNVEDYDLEIDSSAFD
jgi:hypothetical protein